MADPQNFDLIVIGAGPAGYVTAIKAAQLGMSVACVDKQDTLGGTCLNVGCIPSKVLLQSSWKFHEARTGLQDHGILVEGLKLDLAQMMGRKDKIVQNLTQGIQFLFRKNKITFFQGNAQLSSANSVIVTSSESQISLFGKHIVIATGSAPLLLPSLTVDEKIIVTSTGALSLDRVPKHLLIIGGGYIGLEIGSVWRRLGAEVTVVEYSETIVPQMDREVSAAFMRSLQNQGLVFKLNCKVLQGIVQGEGAMVQAQNNATGQLEVIGADVVLLSMGRRPYTDHLGLENVGVTRDEKGFIAINSQFQTSVPSIYAIGDVVRGPMLAHKGEEEGVAVAEILAGQKPQIHYDKIPAIVYTHPEVATVGQTEEQLKEQNIEYKVGKFPFSANSRARANGETEGFVKILTHSLTDEVLGVHILHAEAGSMIAEAVTAMEYRASSEDIARICHAHPTLSEAVKEAALAAHFKAIHI